MRAQIRRAVGRRVGPAVAVVRAVENFDRLRWLYRLRGAVSTGELRFRAPRPVSDDDLALCRRLIDAYHLAVSHAPPPSGMWSHDVFHERQRELKDALVHGSPRAVAELLASMFRADFVLGMALGSLMPKRMSRPRARLSWLSSMNKLVSLAEAIGTARRENPEQGAVGAALRPGVEALTGAIEARLGLSLDFPDVGAAYGIVVGDRVITPETPDQLYTAVRLRDVVYGYVAPATRTPRIVEIGGGCGAMAYWLLQMADAQYVIVDLPIVGVLQGYFLSQALGHDAVSLHGEPQARIMLVPDHALATVPTPFDVLVNKDSLPEIPLDAAIGYLEWARASCRHVFYSDNQESAALFDGVEQNVVCELVERVGGFRRVRRDASWLRRGYVEEIFVPTGTAAADPVSG